MSGVYLLGVDIGTYSSKGVLVRQDGSVIATQVVPHGMENPKPGYFEQDADQVWWSDFVKIVRGLFEKSAVKPEDVAGIGVSAIGSCVLPVDKDGKPLRPAILYGIDTRASKEIRFLERRLKKEFIFQTSGAHLTSQASGPKILWIRNNEPEIFSKTRWFLTSQAYLVFKLTGKPSIDIYTASGYAPLFSTKERRWMEEMGDLITPFDRLPPLYWSHEVVGTVTREAAQLTGLAEGTPVVCGTTDAAAEAIAAGVSAYGDMMLMFGSSVFFIMKTEQMISTQRFWSANFLEKGAFAFLGGMSTAGSLTTWFRDQFAQQEIANFGADGAYSLLAEMAAKSPVGARGLICLPYFEGERTPLHDPEARGVLFGLRLAHTKADIYRAILEGVAFGIRHNFEEMKNEGVWPNNLFAIGGGSKNPLWMHIVADVCGLQISIPQQQIGASYGDAFLAAVGVGLYDNLSEIKKWVKVKEIIEPDFGMHERYQEPYHIFRGLYPRTQSLMHRLAKYVEKMNILN